MMLMSTALVASSDPIDILQHSSDRSSYPAAMPSPPPIRPPEPKGYPRPARQSAGSISDADYPSSAIVNEQQGTVTANFVVGKTGIVQSCTASGLEQSPVLMETTCTLIKQRFRYQPALISKGRPVEESKTIRITWRLPTDPWDEPIDIVGKGSGRDVTLRLTVTSQGQIVRCMLELGQNWAALHEAEICSQFSQGYSPRPVKLVNGKPAPYVERALITISGRGF